MNQKKYRSILYIIIVTMLITIVVQCYWNYKNYQINKQQLINDVQTGLDKAVDDYYAQLAERTTIAFAYQDSTSFAADDNTKFKDIFKSIDIDTPNKTIKQLDSIKSSINSIAIFRGRSADSLMKSTKTGMDTSKPKKAIYSKTTAVSSIDFKNLTTKVFISINTDTLALKTVDSLFVDELSRKNISLKHRLNFVDAQGVQTQTDSLKTEKNNLLETVSKSTFLPKKSELKVQFTDEAKLVLQRMYGSILISVLLILAVIGSLIYLLKIIKNQKQLAEVKNDLISNVTHEFKTPIATISVALESIKDFNVIDNKEKTKSYIDMSKNQLDKLNIMVEKLLETATLDSENLNLNKETVSITDMLINLAGKHQMHTQTKTITLNSTTIVDAYVDIFHFENAINNVIDNAVKYGGNTITINLQNTKNGFEILVSDDGNTLTKAHKEVVFEKFYRVPKGNTHDVKGFGIGLYYTKKIIEKHNGSIDLLTDVTLTTFKIYIPNATA